MTGNEKCALGDALGGPNAMHTPLFKGGSALGGGEEQSIKAPFRQAVIEPAGTLRPVFWESDGKILGPGRVSYVARDRDQFFLCVEFEDSWRWVNSDLLRSREAFERQAAWTCPTCKGTASWRSEHVAAICRRCHPPASSPIAKGGKP
jgi:hypothetical protein